MRKIVLSAACAISTLVMAGSAQAITITVTPTSAPNVFGSPHWSTWAQNSLYALENGLSAYGDSSLPSYYQAQSNITIDDIMVTSNASWKGQADPGAVFGAAFASEHGNRGHFGLIIDGDGDQFAIADLSFVGSSNDSGNALGFSWSAGDYAYNERYVGILFGGDGAIGGGDDTYVTGGAATQLVDALIGVGSGNAFWPDESCATCSTPAGLQANIDAFKASGDLPTAFTGTYTLGSATGSGTFNIAAVPEPATWLSMILGFGFVGGALRARRPVRSELRA